MIRCIASSIPMLPPTFLNKLYIFPKKNSFYKDFFDIFFLVSKISLKFTYLPDNAGQILCIDLPVPVQIQHFECLKFKLIKKLCFLDITDPPPEVLRRDPPA